MLKPISWAPFRLTHWTSCRLRNHAALTVFDENVLIVAKNRKAALPRRGLHRMLSSRSAGAGGEETGASNFRNEHAICGTIIKTLFGIATLIAATPAIAEEFHFRAERILGASYELTVSSSNEASARDAHETALAEIVRLENILSTWKAGSEISRLNEASDFTASQELLDFLSACETLREKTGNAVSCRIGKLIDAWRTAEETGVVPDESKLQVLAEDIAEAPLTLDPATGDVHRPDMVVFAVDAMAKGWILDRAAARALEISKDVKGVILNIGGDLKIAGDVSAHAPRVGVSGPRAGDNEAPIETISIDKGGVASSGAGMRDMEVAGRKFSHILSPTTGQPQSGTSVTSVVAPTAAEADAFATAFAVMGIGKSLAFASARDEIEAVIVTSGGGRFASEGWSSLIAPVENVSADAAGVENPWPDGYELDIEYEVPSIDAANYEAPYVAVWVTNPEKELVRSLLLLGDAPRWVEENYRFWRRYGRKHPALVDTLAQPTRRPGRYRLVWDGRNEAGEPVPQGTYAIHVEASREHGGHSYASRELHLSAAPTEAIIPAQEEIGEVVLHYGSDE